VCADRDKSRDHHGAAGDAIQAFDLQRGFFKSSLENGIHKPAISGHFSNTSARQSALAYTTKISRTATRASIAGGTDRDAAP
jgi:hypothetical protein